MVITICNDRDSLLAAGVKFRMLLRCRSKLKKDRHVVTLIIIFFILFFTFIFFYAKFKYEVTSLDIIKEIGVYARLSLIKIGVNLYDPSTTIHPAFYPYFSKNYNENYYKVIEKNLKTPNVRIIDINNKKNRYSSFRFAYQPYNDIRLEKLAKEYKLNDIVANSSDEFEKLVRLRTWCRSQFSRNDFQPIMENFNALHVLKRNLRNNGFQKVPLGYYSPCNFFPLFYSQVLLSMGYTARICTISSNKNYRGHGLVEVWSNQWDKWIAMDADLNLHYINRKGVPQNILNLHNQRYLNEVEIEIVYGKKYSGDSGKMQVSPQLNKRNISDMINYSSYFLIDDMRNDWLTNHYSKGHPVKSSELFWIDKKLPAGFILRDKTSLFDDFYWTLNRTTIKSKPLNNKFLSKLDLFFDTYTPNFDYFIVEVDKKEKKIINTPYYKWPIHSGANQISVVSVNKFGVIGVPSHITIELLDDK